MKLKLKVEIKKLLCCLAFFSVLILSAEHAYATYVGLGDGSYDVTLTSVYPNTAYTGTLTILGNEATDWMFIMPSYLGGTFSGNPNEETIPPPTDLELLRGPVRSPLTNCGFTTGCLEGRGNGTYSPAGSR